MVLIIAAFLVSSFIFIFFLTFLATNFSIFVPAHCRPNQKPNKTEPTTVMSGPVPDFIWLGLALPKFAKNKLKPTDAHP